MDLSDGKRYLFIGLSKEQNYAFDYGVYIKDKLESYSIHLSHILNSQNIIVYNKTHRLTNEEVLYLYKDLGGKE